MKYTYWESAGKYFVNDTTNLCAETSKWWYPARLMRIPLTDFILLLKNKFNAFIISYNQQNDFLYYYFDSEINAKKFCNFINKIQLVDKNLFL